LCPRVSGPEGAARFSEEPVRDRFVAASFHVDTEAICPDCHGWINPWDFVRRNALDILEHEVCPPVVVRQSRS